VSEADPESTEEPADESRANDNPDGDLASAEAPADESQVIADPNVSEDEPLTTDTVAEPDAIESRNLSFSNSPNMHFPPSDGPEPQNGCDPESEVARIVATRVPPSPSSCPPLLEYAKRKTVESLLHDDYHLAHRYKTAERVIEKALREERQRTDTDSWLSSLDGRLSFLRRQISDAASKWSDRIAAEDADFAARTAEAEERHAEERRALEDEWASPIARMCFDKASPGLLQLRQVQRNQALSRDFVSALATKAVADERQRVEIGEAQARAFEAARVQYAWLIGRQQLEIAVASERHAQVVANMTEGREKEIAALERTVAQVEGKKSMQVPRFTGPAITRPRSVVLGGRPTSPATRRSLYAYRTSEEQGRLGLPALGATDSFSPGVGESQKVRQRTTKKYRPLRV
jgi:hypothetical protein